MKTVSRNPVTVALQWAIIVAVIVFFVYVRQAPQPEQGMRVYVEIEVGSVTYRIDEEGQFSEKRAGRWMAIATPDEDQLTRLKQKLSYLESNLP